MMNERKLTPKERAETEMAFEIWKQEKLSDCMCMINNTTDFDNDYMDELNGIVKLLDEALTVSFMEEDSTFDFLNQSFKLHMAEMKRIGILSPERMDKNLEIFLQLSGLVRSIMINKNGLIKIFSHYEGLKFNMKLLLEESEKQEELAREKLIQTT
jgi:hypothetical protein